MGLETKIWAFEEEKEKISLCETLGHRPLHGRRPAPALNYNHDLLKEGTGTADQLTLLRLLKNMTDSRSHQQTARRTSNATTHPNKRRDCGRKLQNEGDSESL